MIKPLSHRSLLKPHHRYQTKPRQRQPATNNINNSRPNNTQPQVRQDNHPSPSWARAADYWPRDPHRPSLNHGPSLSNTLTRPTHDNTKTSHLNTRARPPAAHDDDNNMRPGNNRCEYCYEAGHNSNILATFNVDAALSTVTKKNTAGTRPQINTCNVHIGHDDSATCEEIVNCVNNENVPSSTTLPFINEDVTFVNNVNNDDDTLSDVPCNEIKYHDYPITLYINVKSIRHILIELSPMLYECWVDILIIGESKFFSFPDSQFHVQNYSLYRKDRTSHGGGVMIYVNNCIPHCVRYDFDDYIQNGLEGIAIELNFNKKDGSYQGCLLGFNHDEILERLNEIGPFYFK